VGKEFWTEMVKFSQMIDFGVIDENDMQMIYFAETASEIWGVIKNYYQLS
jgi:hypothetical protein